jgi:hypothetical protein
MELQSGSEKTKIKMNDNTIHQLSSDIKEYVKVQGRIVELEINSKAANAGAAVFSAIFIGFLILIAFLFMNFSLALFLSQKLGSFTQGFVAVGLCYAVMSVILLIFRKPLLQYPLRDKIISSITH